MVPLKTYFLSMKKTDFRPQTSLTKKPEKRYLKKIHFFGSFKNLKGTIDLECRSFRFDTSILKEKHVNKLIANCSIFTQH